MCACRWSMREERRRENLRTHHRRVLILGIPPRLFPALCIVVGDDEPFGGLFPLALLGLLLWFCIGIEVVLS